MPAPSGGPSTVLPWQSAVPPGWRVAACPPGDILAFGAVRGRNLLGATVLVHWPADGGWLLGTVDEQVLVPGVRGQFDVPAVQANFKVVYELDHTHAYHSLASVGYGDACDRGRQWVLLERMPAPGPRDFSGCQWPGCPCFSHEFDRASLLRHAREAHGGCLSDDLLAWAGAVVCPHCKLPFKSLHGHYKKDAVDGVSKCPRLCSAAPGGRSVLSDADNSFVASLSMDDVMVRDASSLLDIPGAAASAVAAAVSPLLEHHLASPLSEEPFKLLMVVWTALLRPVPRGDTVTVAVRRRCQLLAAGGNLESLWRVNSSRPRARLQPGDGENVDLQTGASVSASRKAGGRRRALALVRSGLLGKARAALENVLPMGWCAW